MLHIAVEREGQPRKELRFAKDVIVVGREAEHDLQLNFEDGASRQHCRFSNERGQVFVEDLGSRNGTKVNGRRIAAKTAIGPDDVIEVGKVKVRLVEQGGAAARGAARGRPAAASPAAAAEPAARARPEPAPAKRPAEPDPRARKEPAAASPAPKDRKEPAAAKAAKPAPAPEVPAPDSSIKVNLKTTDEPPPAAAEAKASGPIHDENEACRSQIDPLARRWRDLGRPDGLLLHGPLLKRGLAWIASDRKLRPRPSELHREFINASAGDRRRRIRDLGIRAGAVAFALVGGNVAAHILHDDLALGSAAAGGDSGASQCTPDHPAMQRANVLAQKASEVTDLEVAILAGARAVAAADGPCARQAEAERVLRHALSRQRSRIIGRADAPIRAADVGRDERDVVTVDDSGGVTLWDRTGAGLPRPLSSSSGPGKVAALGPEGRWLAVGTAKGTVDLWDLDQRSAPKLAKQLENHREAITAIEFSEDGRLFASGDRRGNITIWDMRGTDAGVKLGDLREHRGAIEKLVFRDGGKRLYSFGGKQAFAWDLQDGRRKGKPLQLKIGGDTTAFAVNGEGDEVVLGDDIGQVVRWRVRTLARAEQDALASHEGKVVDVAFLPGARAVLSLGIDKQLIVTELDQMMRQGSEPLRVGLRGLQAEPTALAADPTGRRIAVAARDHRIYVWDATARHTQAQPVVFDEHTDKIEAVLASFDGNNLLSASADGTLRLWPLQSTDAGGALAVLSDHRAGILKLGLSSDGSRLVSLGADKAVRAWRLDNRGAPRRILDKTYESAPLALTLSPDGRWAAVGLDRTLVLYDLTSGEREPRPIERTQHNDGINQIAFSADGDWLVSADFSGLVNTWAMREAGPDDTPARSTSLGRRLDALALAPTTPYFAAATSDNRVTLWPMTGTGGEHFVAPHEKTVLSLVFSPGGDYLVSTSEDARALLRKVDKGRTEELPERSAIGHDTRVRAAAFSYDKRWLATGSDDGVINMTDLSKMTERSRPLKGHEGAITALMFEPASEVLISASVDKTIRLWLVDDLDRGGEVRSIPLTGHTGAIDALRVDGTGRFVVSGGAEGAIRVWPLKQDLLIALACRTVGGRDLTADEWAMLYPGETFEALCEGR